MLVILNTIGPLVVLVVLGVALRRSGFLQEGFYEGANRLVYWIGLPSLLFSSLTKTSVNPGSALALVGVLYVATVLGLCIAYAVGGLILRLTRPSLGAFVQGAWRGNLAYVGVPVVVYAMQSRGLDPQGQTQALAVVGLGALSAFFNVLAVLVLVRGQEGTHASLSHALGHACRKTLTNPQILACVAGLLVGRYSPDGLPIVLERSFAAVSDVVLPLALMGIGAQLSWRNVGSVFKPALAGALIKILVMPLVGYAVGRAFGLSDEPMRVVLVFCACPTAVMSYVMAEQMKNDAELAAGIVALSVVISLFSMSATLLLLP